MSSAPRRLRALLAAAAFAGCAVPPRAPEPTRPEPPDPRARFIAEGDRAFERRDDPHELARSIERWRQAVALGDSFELRVKLARAEHFQALGLGQVMRRSGLERGADDAEKALELVRIAAKEGCAEPTREAVPAAYWRAENLESLAHELGLVAGAKMRAEALCLAKRTAKIDAAYFHAGPLRLLGRLLAQLPALSGGNAQASRAAFERAVALAPEFAANRVDYAATCAVKLQDARSFRETLAAVLAAPVDDPGIAAENRRARDRALRLGAEEPILFK